MGLSRDVLRVFYVIPCSLATYLFSHWKPLGFKVLKDSQCLSLYNSFLENMYILNLKLSNKFVFQFYDITTMFDDYYKLKFKSSTQVV